MSRLFDVCVVGAGLVGSCAALVAARHGHSVAVLEPSPANPQPTRLGVQARNVAVSPASRELLRSVGVDAGGAPFHAMEVWEERGTADIRFAAEEAGLDALGWMVEVDVLAARLWEALERADGVALFPGASVNGLESLEGRYVVGTNDGALECRHLFAADGGRSTIRQLLDVPVERRDTGHHALATIVRTSRPHGAVARQRFLRTGPLALLPTAEDDLCSIVWSQPPEAADLRKTQGEDEFCAALTTASGGCLGEILAVDARFVFPIVQSCAQNFQPQPGILLLGDAARVIHPLAGLGVNLGFEDVLGLAERFHDAADLAAMDWAEFARRRRARALAVMRLMETFQRLYGGTNPLLSWVRNTAVRAVDGSGALKRQILREAAGLGPVALQLR